MVTRTSASLVFLRVCSTDEKIDRELLATKKLYDPLGVFTARKAVGSEVVGW